MLRGGCHQYFVRGTSQPINVEQWHTALSPAKHSHYTTYANLLPKPFWFSFASEEDICSCSKTSGVVYKVQLVYPDCVIALLPEKITKERGEIKRSRGFLIRNICFAQLEGQHLWVTHISTLYHNLRDLSTAILMRVSFCAIEVAVLAWETTVSSL